MPVLHSAASAVTSASLACSCALLGCLSACTDNTAEHGSLTAICPCTCLPDDSALPDRWTTSSTSCCKYTSVLVKHSSCMLFSSALHAASCALRDDRISAFEPLPHPLGMQRLFSLTGSCAAQHCWDCLSCDSHS